MYGSELRSFVCTAWESEVRDICSRARNIFKPHDNGREEELEFSKARNQAEGS